MRLKNGFVIREICGEKVLSAEGSDCIDFNKLIRLNETAAYLLESVGDAEFTESSLADLLCEKYDVTRDKALADAKSLCAKLKDNNVVD